MARDKVDTTGPENGAQSGAQSGALKQEQNAGLAEVIQLPIKKSTTKSRGKGKKAKDRYRGVRYIKARPPKRPHARLRYLDPKVGKEVDYILKPDELDNIEGVRERIWFQLQNDRLAQGKLLSSDPEVPNEQIVNVIKGYFLGRGGTKSEGTQKEYRASADRFLEFCRINGIRTVHQLNRAVLSEFVKWVIAQPRQVPKKGGKKGEKKVAKGKGKTARVNETRNKDIRQVRAILNRLRKDGAIRMSRDDIADTLEELTAKTVKKPFLRPDKLVALLKSCRDYDAKHDRPALPVILFLLLTGMRVEEAVLIEWSAVEQQSIEIPAEITKAKKARSVPLTITPMLAAMLHKGRKDKTGRVLGEYSIDIIENICRDLVENCGAPKFTPQTLRRTCGTYICCAPSIYGGATGSAPHMAAARLGHGLGVSQKHYVGVVDIPRKAKTIEDAMQLARLIGRDAIPRI